MANNNVEPINWRAERRAQFEAVYKFAFGEADDLGGIHLVPQNLTYFNYDSDLIDNLIPKVYAIWSRLPNKEMAIRYDMFLKNNPEFSDLYKTEEFRKVLTNPSGAPADFETANAGPYGPMYVFNKAYDIKHPPHVQRSYDIFTTYYLRDGLHFYSSLLNALLTPLPPMAAYGGIEAGGGGANGRSFLSRLFSRGTKIAPSELMGGRRSRTMRRHKSKLSKTRRNRRRSSRRN